MQIVAEQRAQLSHSDTHERDLLEELVATEHDEQQQEIAEQVQATRHEQTETRMDLQKVGQMVETAQKWVYISIAAVFVWKVAAATWNRCTPAAVGRDTQAKPQRTAVPPPPAAENTKPGDPFYMA